MCKDFVMKNKLKKIVCHDEDHFNAECEFVVKGSMGHEDSDYYFGNVYVDINGNLSFSYDDNVQDTSDLKRAIKKVGINKIHVHASCDLCEDESVVTYIFNDGTVTKDNKEAFIKAFKGLLF